MKVKILIGILVVLIAVNLGTLGSYVYMQCRGGKGVSARDRSSHPMFPPPGRPDLQLKKEQRQQLRKLLREFHADTQPQRKQIWTLEQETFEFLQQDPLPMGKIEEKLKEVVDLRLQISKAAIDKMVSARSFLTPEQRERFFEAIIQSRPEMPDGRPTFPRHRPQPDIKQDME